MTATTSSAARHNQAAREKRSVALTSVLAAVFITGLKLVVGLQTNSLGILSEAAHSGLDFVAALMTYIAVRIADRPPDSEHPYGHGKIESLSAFLETLLLVITCAWIIWEALHRLLVRTPHVESSIWGFVVIGTAILVDIGRSRSLSRMAKKHKSQALEADALHFSSDVWSSLVVLGGLVFVSIGYAWLDAVAAIGVALLVLFVSYRLGRRTVDALMDRVPEGLYERVLSAVRAVEGVEEIRSIRIRPSGAQVFIDMTIAIRRTVPFQQAHLIMDNVERAIHKLGEHTDVVVHAEPLTSADETLADKIRMIVIRKGLSAPHNLEVHNADGMHHVDFDIEYRRGKSFVEAHDIASEVEEEIRREIPSIAHLTIHMEESESGVGEAARRQLDNEVLRKSIKAVLREDRRILKCPSINILPVGDRFNLSVTCEFDSARTLDEIHQIICQAETRLYDRFSALRRVTVHAEPR
jgi:cation diffusion facilitator family transporter